MDESLVDFLTKRIRIIVDIIDQDDLKNYQKIRFCMIIRESAILISKLLILADAADVTAYLARYPKDITMTINAARADMRCKDRHP